MQMLYGESVRNWEPVATAIGSNEFALASGTVISLPVSIENGFFYRIWLIDNSQNRVYMHPLHGGIWRWFGFLSCSRMSSFLRRGFAQNLRPAYVSTIKSICVFIVMVVGAEGHRKCFGCIHACNCVCGRL